MGAAQGPAAAMGAEADEAAAYIPRMEMYPSVLFPGDELHRGRRRHGHQRGLGSPRRRPFVAQAPRGGETMPTCPGGRNVTGGGSRVKREGLNLANYILDAARP